MVTKLATSKLRDFSSPWHLSWNVPKLLLSVKTRSEARYNLQVGADEGIAEVLKDEGIGLRLMKPTIVQKTIYKFR